MRLTFLESFEFGIPEIDQGHRRIFNLFNEIGDCLKGGDYESALRQVVHLIAVERVHVRFESSLLRKFRSIHASKHEEFHVTLYRSLNELMVALGDQDRKAAEKCHFDLCQNITDDILIADLPFKSLFQHKILNR